MQVGGWLRVGIRLMKSGGNCKLATEPNKWLLWRQCEDTQAAAALAACGRGSGSGSRRGRHLRDLHDVSVVVAPRCGDVCNVDHAGPAGRDTGPGGGEAGIGQRCGCGIDWQLGVLSEAAGLRQAEWQAQHSEGAAQKKPGTRVQHKQWLQAWHPRGFLEQIDSQHLICRQLRNVWQRRLHVGAGGKGRRRGGKRLGVAPAQCKRDWRLAAALGAGIANGTAAACLVFHGGWQGCCGTPAACNAGPGAIAVAAKQAPQPAPVCLGGLGVGCCGKERKGCRPGHQPAAQHAAAPLPAGCCCGRGQSLQARCSCCPLPGSRLLHAKQTPLLSQQPVLALPAAGAGAPATGTAAMAARAGKHLQRAAGLCCSPVRCCCAKRGACNAQSLAD